MPRDNLTDALKQAVMTLIAGLEMAADDAGFTIAGRVYGQLLPDDPNVTLPCWVVVADRGSKEELLPGDSEFKERIVPFQLLLKDRHGDLDQAKDAQYRSWREEVIDAFHQQRPLADVVPGARWCLIETDDVYKQTDEAYQEVVSGLRLKCWLREPRRRGEILAAGRVAAPGTG